MKVVAILGGLGSQMYKYAFYLQLKNEEDTYIDTTPFKLHDMWNGYELEKIFGIHEKDICSVFSADELQKLREANTHYKMAASIAMKKIDSQKPIVSFLRGYFYPQQWDDAKDRNKLLQFCALAYNKIKRTVKGKDNPDDSYPLFYKTNLFSIYYDEFSSISDRYIGGGTQKELFKSIFKFPPLEDSANIKIAEMMHMSESVAIHVRRSDHMYDNKELFADNYFAKAVNYIKRTVSTPVFFLFSDETEWCVNNLSALGFKGDDNIQIVDWNKGNQSFRDMQLMTYCQHNILAISSFSWWGYYLSERKNKIVCAPKGWWLEVPVHL